MNKLTNLDPNTRGKQAEKIVKQNLWRRNYRVKDVSYAGIGFDLLVEDKWRVEVKSVSGSTTISLKVDNFDVLAIVYIGPISNEILYLKEKSTLERLLKTGNIYKFSEDDFNTHFTKKPQEVFVK